MRTIAALALVLAVTMVLYRSAEAAEARIESFAFVCETPGGQALKPRHGDVAGVVFADLPAQREQCLETIDFKIALCRENRDFGSGIDGGTHGACLPVFEQQAKACIGHFTFERDKCDAAGAGAEQAAPAPAYTVYPIDTVMEAVERANLRAGPGTDHAVVGTLDVGASVRATGTVETGTVEGRDWLRVELPEDGGAAFVYAPLLKEVLTAASLGPDWIATENDGCLMHNPTPQPDETATWSGACVDDRVSGEGLAVWRHGGGTETYEGGMKAGKRHGRGTFVTAEGNRYEGAWRDGTMDGSGTYTWSGGDRYEGNWRDGTFHGRGTYRLGRRQPLQGRVARRQGARIRHQRLAGAGATTRASGRAARPTDKVFSPTMAAPRSRAGGAAVASRIESDTRTGWDRRHRAPAPPPGARSARLAYAPCGAPARSRRPGRCAARSAPHATSGYRRMSDGRLRPVTPSPPLRAERAGERWGPGRRLGARGCAMRVERASR